ncbi:MAG: ClbS/DfsB family four-helix bundle protein [Flavobacteriales bacterium]|nr:ClbS/DfsB family four-helix bundle protein [Flavobacteriales bacterium]
MSRPTNKKELLYLSQANYHKLLNLIEAIPKNERLEEFPSGTLNRNIKDVLAHLHEWHLMMLDWYAVGMTDKMPDMPKAGYNWRMLPELNRAIWEKYKDDDYDKIVRAFKTSYADVRRLIENHSDHGLFQKKKYPWTGSTSLGAYLVSATSSHYDWAIKLIKKCRKKMQSTT